MQLRAHEATTLGSFDAIKPDFIPANFPFFAELGITDLTPCPMRFFFYRCEQIPNPSVFKVKGTLGVQHESPNDIQLKFQVDSVELCEAFLIAKI